MPSTSGPILVLVGPPGSGKTSVGRWVAEAVGARFRDFDEDIERHTGMPAGELVVKLGRAGFMEVEAELVTAALADDGVVLALGGGTPLNPDVREQLKPFHVVFLEVELDELLRREGLVPLHPWLLPNPRAHLRKLLTDRYPIYTEVAKVVVSTNGRAVDDVAAEVLSGLPSPGVSAVPYT